MSRAPGSRIGHYEITNHLGSGGMGEVYRANDTQLGRQVALKVLPDSVAGDAQRLARFDREARTLAILNHPNIAQIYGTADAAAAGDGAQTRALVMELVEGPTLADRIAEGPLPLDEALAIAQQIADALDAAHAQGIIHRDLKPANIKVRPDGRVKVLDFGLAKAIAGAGEAGAVGAGRDVTHSPTLTTPAMTAAGVLLGTAAYMSPEQARGRPVDRRTDIWAFGCVLFEMLTGKRAFPGHDVTDTLAAIVRAEPEWSALPADVPPRLKTALQVCLKKDQSQRIRDIGDVRLALDGAFDQPGTAATDTTLAPSPRTNAITWVALAALIVAVVVGVIGWTRRPSSAAATVARFALPLAPGDNMPDGVRPSIGFALSPDERTMVYTAIRKDVRQLFRRPVGELVAVPIPGTETAVQPFFSPDGKWVGYFSERDLALKKIAVDGGVSVTLAAVRRNPQFATWLSDGTIVYGTEQQPLTKVSENGGPTTPLVGTEPGEVELRNPSAVPGRRAIVFTSAPANMIHAFDLDTGKRSKLIPGTDPHVTSHGELVFIRDGTLWAAPFDARALAVTGDARPVLAHPAASSLIVQSAIGAGGTLLYLTQRSASPAEQPFDVTWVDQRGQPQPMSLPARPYDFPRLSPDGARLAASIRTAREQGAVEHDIWVYDLRTGAGIRLTHEGDNRLPLWTADGQRIVFSSTLNAPPPSGSQTTWYGNLYQVRADGTRDVERLTKTGENQALSGMSPDGRELFYTRVVDLSEWHVMRVNVDKPDEPTPITSGKFSHASGEVSPNGHLFSYRSNESGRFEIYVQPYPSLDGKIAVSVGGGLEPIWSADSKTLFYRAGDKVMAVDVLDKPQLRASPPRELFAGQYVLGSASGGRQLHVGPDGRFVMMKTVPIDAAPSDDQPFVAVFNWFQELQARLATP